MLRILLTSDVHLGMKFAAYPDIQADLSEERFRTLERLVESANQNGCDLFVIAGDLFDRVTVAKRDILRASQILNEFHGRLVAVLPGNHDFLSKGQADLWTLFRENGRDHLLILEEKRAYPLLHYDLEVILYPAPCASKHSVENAIGWIRGVSRDEAVRHHIGIAHGSLEGFSPDFDQRYYPMTAQELLGCGMDLWLMGHTHNPYPLHPDPTDRIFYPGTPEPDGFDCIHEGKVWILDVAEDNAITPRCISAGRYRFLHEEIEINDPADLNVLNEKFTAPGYKDTLLKLRLRGRLPKEEYPLLSALRKRLDETLFHLSWNDTEVNEEITLEGIYQEFTEGSFPYRLLTTLAQRNDSEALQTAYELIRELRKRLE